MAIDVVTLALAKNYTDEHGSTGSHSAEKITYDETISPHTTGSVAEQLSSQSSQIEELQDGTGLDDGAVTPSKTSFFDIRISPNLYNPVNVGKYLNTNGQLGNNASYTTSDYIEVEEDDEIHYQFTYNGNRYDSVEQPNYATIRFICCYDSNKEFISSISRLESQSSYTVQSGTSFIRVTLTTSNSAFSEFAILKQDDTTIVPYNPFGIIYQYVKKANLRTEKFVSAMTKNGAITASNTGTVISITVPQFKKNKTISFLGFFDSWADLYIYQGKNTGFTERFCKITSTTVELYKQGSNTPYFTASHGLTLSTYISAVIAELDDGTAKIYISSNGASYTSTDTAWGGSMMAVSAEHGSTSWDNILSWGSTDILERVWMYGDSYFDHWTPLIISRGYKSFVDDGYSGGSSTNGLVSFKKALELGCPSKVVWCLGMNDSDNSAINSNWLSAITSVKALCDENDIDLVVCTIPNVCGVSGTSAARDHTYKNTYIKANFNYIDIAEYVGSNESNEWYTGLLSSDGVHPSTAGDFYIANIMQTFVPELRRS